MNKKIFTMAIGNINPLLDNQVELALDIRANKPFLPKSHIPSTDSHKGINQIITDAGISYRWVVCLANDFGNLKKDYKTWLSEANLLLKSIAQDTIQHGISRLCVLCNESDTRIQAAIALQTELNKINGGWEIEHL